MDTLLSSHSKTNRLLQLRHMLGGGQEKLNILVYGAGVLGSLCAARLHQAGHTVSILARGQRNIDLRQHGVVLENALTGELDTIFVSVVDQLNVDDAYDLVMVIMRKNQVLPILPTLAANQHTPTIAFLGNNAAGSDVYVQALGRERVLLPCARATSSPISPDRMAVFQSCWAKLTAVCRPGCGRLLLPSKAPSCASASA